MSTSSSTTTTERPILSDDERTLPKTCPSWCTTDHAQDLAQGATMWDACQHRAYLGDVFLAELSNSGRVWRPGGGWFDVALQQDPHPTENMGNGTDPLVRVWTQEGSGLTREATLRLTTGEARVLAAKLLSAADRADIES